MNLRISLLLALLMATALLIVGQLYLTIGLTERLVTQFVVTPERAAWAGSAFGFAYAAGFLLLGSLSDRFGRRKVLIVGVLATGFATALLGVTASMDQFLLGRTFQGFAASTFPPCALALVAEALPPARRGLGVSLMSFAFLAAAPLAQIMASALQLSGTEIMLALSPLYALCVLGLWALIPPGDPGQSAASAASPATEARIAPPVIASWLAATTILFAFVSFQIGAGRLASAGAANGDLVRLMGLPPLLLTIAAAPLSARYGTLTTAQAGMCLLVAGCALAGLQPSMLIATSILIGAGVALVVPGLIATIASATLASYRAQAIAIYTFCLFVGASVAPPVAAALSDGRGAAVFLVPVVPMLIALLGLTIAKRAPAQPVVPR